MSLKGTELYLYEKQFQAQMAAYKLAVHFGFPSDEFSFSYLISWTQRRNWRDKQDFATFDEPMKLIYGAQTSLKRLRNQRP